MIAGKSWTESGAVRRGMALVFLLSFAAAAFAQLTTATISGLVGESEVRDLPLNARNLVELAALFPGITMDKGAGGSVSKGFATKLAIVGTRYNANLFQLDGQDINDNTGSSGGAAGILMGV